MVLGSCLGNLEQILEGLLLLWEFFAGIQNQIEDIRAKKLPEFKRGALGMDLTAVKLEVS